MTLEKYWNPIGKPIRAREVKIAGFFLVRPSRYARMTLQEVRLNLNPLPHHRAEQQPSRHHRGLHCCARQFLIRHRPEQNRASLRPSTSRSTSVQVIKRHRCAGFVCLYDDVAFYLPNDRHAEQTVEEEPLVVSEVCHHDL